jgi:hypothetical protein
MSTDRIFPHIHSSKLLSADVLRERVINMLLDEYAEWQRSMFPVAGVFDTALGLAAGGAGANYFSIVSAGGRRAVDGIGGTMRVGAADVRLVDVPFGNAIAETYDVALQIAYYPAAADGQNLLETSPDTKKLAYRTFKETIGRMGHPKAVTVDEDGYITFDVDNFFLNTADADDSMIGRSARVWLEQPESAFPTTAVQQLSVEAGDDSDYQLKTLIGDGISFGWATPSEDPKDYWICVEGPTIYKRTTRDLRSAFALTGTVTTSVPSTGSYGVLTGAGTSFLAQLKAGDIVQAPDGRVHVVVSVLSNTLAHTLRQFPAAQWSAVAIKVTGFCYLGTVLGEGSGNAPVTFGTSDQVVIPFNMSQIAEVLRKDSHGKMKVRVKADASDAEEKQLEVQDNAGTTNFSVDEDGDVLLASLHAKPQQTLPVEMGARTAAVTGDNPLAAFTATVVGHAGDSTGGDVALRFLAAFAADLIDDAGGRAKYAFAAHRAGDDWSAILAALHNNVPAVAQLNAAQTDVLSLLKLNDDDELELGSNTPVITQNAASAAWAFMHAWKTGASDQVRVYVAKTAASALQACLTINASWNQSSAALTDAGWTCIDTGKTCVRVLLDTATGGVQLQFHAASGAAFADAAWATLGNANSDMISWRSNAVDANGVVAHQLQVANALASGVARYFEIISASGGKLAWVNHRGGLDFAASCFDEDFYGKIVDVTNRWTVTPTTVGDATIVNPGAADSGGWARIEAGSNVDEAVCLQVPVGQFTKAARPIVRIRMTYPATNNLIEIGLAVGTAFGGDGIYLRRDTSVNTNWYLVTNDAGGEDAQPFADVGGIAVFEIVVEASVVKVFVNGATAPAATCTTNIPTSALRPTARIKTVTTGGTFKDIFLDRMTIWQDRDA